jgi:hypothetical protein
MDLTALDSLLTLPVELFQELADLTEAQVKGAAAKGAEQADATFDKRVSSVIDRVMAARDALQAPPGETMTEGGAKPPARTPLATLFAASKVFTLATNDPGPEVTAPGKKRTARKKKRPRR